MRRPITRKEFHKVERQVRDALKQASTHDPDLVKEIKSLTIRVDRVWRAIVVLQSEAALAERRLDRIGAPKYRRVR